MFAFIFQKHYLSIQLEFCHWVPEKSHQAVAVGYISDKQNSREQFLFDRHQASEPSTYKHNHLTKNLHMFF